MKHSDYCTHIKNPEDKDILTRKLFDVNMRLFNSSERYRHIILEAAYYIMYCCEVEKEGYSKPLGWSGANAGIPWNIIAYRISENHSRVLINPKIINQSDETYVAQSNCGSLVLDKPISITRPTWIEVEYYNLFGKQRKQKYMVSEKSGTIMHEIEHNLGILITDK